MQVAAIESAIDTLFLSLDSAGRVECLTRFLPLINDSERETVRERIEQLKGTEPEPVPAKRQRTAESDGGAPEFKLGDWMCVSCSAHNFKKQMACFKCNTPRYPGLMGAGMGGFGGSIGQGFGGGGMVPGMMGLDGNSRPGDWICRNCGVNCYGSKSECFKCGTPKPAGGGGMGGMMGFDAPPGTTRPGDWVCGSCNATVFASKSECFKCGAQRPSQPQLAAVGMSMFGNPADQKRPGDWTCPTCQVNVFGSRSECFRCRAPKPPGV